MSEHTQSHGRGIAVGVRRRWPTKHDAYTEVCRSGQLHPGGSSRPRMNSPKATRSPTIPSSPVFTCSRSLTTTSADEGGPVPAVVWAARGWVLEARRLTRLDRSCHASRRSRPGRAVPTRPASC